MAGVSASDVPEGSLLAGYGGAEDYRDCFCRVVPGAVSLSQYIERFYCGPAFRPERLVLGLIGRGASNADARAFARGETDRIAVWQVVERRENEILLLSADTGTASWLAVEPQDGETRLRFGTWVGTVGQRPVMLGLHRVHRLYSRMLLGGC